MLEWVPFVALVGLIQFHTLASVNAVNNPTSDEMDPRNRSSPNQVLVIPGQDLNRARAAWQRPKHL